MVWKDKISISMFIKLGQNSDVCDGKIRIPMSLTIGQEFQRLEQ